MKINNYGEKGYKVEIDTLFLPTELESIVVVYSSDKPHKSRLEYLETIEEALNK
jgi:hypothetical protein